MSKISAEDKLKLANKKIKIEKEKNEYSKIKKTLPKIPVFKSIIFFLSFSYVAIMTVVTIYFTTFVFRALIDKNYNKFMMWFLINLGVTTSFLIIKYVSEYFLEKECSILKTKLRRYIFKSYSCEEGQRKISEAPGSFKSITIDSVDKYVDNTIRHKYSLMQNLLRMFIGGFLIFYISWIIGLAALGLCIFVIFSMGFISPFLSKGQKEIEGNINKLEDEISSNLSLHSVFYLNNSSNVVVGFLKRKFAWIEKKIVRFISKAMLSQTPSIIMGIFVEFGLIVIACILVINGKISKESLVAIGMVTTLFTGSVFQLTENMQDVLQYAKLFHFFVPTIEQPIVLKYIKDINQISIKNYNIAFEGKKLFEDNINLQLFKGKKYVIVGDSGSGKSTLINSILGKQNTYEGTIEISNNNSKELSSKTIINNIGILNSEPYVFNATLFENIALFDKSANIEDIKNILKAIKFNDLELDKKIDITSISEGQKQKINFARIVLKNPGWIISDEGFSNIDRVSRGYIMDYLSKVYDGGLINITHHLSKKEEVIYDSKISL
ncbi:ATP-binding cassette domain-containing protein [Mycoplasma marinum]|uniref:ABC transmembrane type-1 domain-containing protein n=1 Tax=Mycoplasma marinum TaxID=1937190 RepID=A0A4R0XUR7_9MOLU|nr:ABC transporter ATP-binding protein [Mycoplasma marinum]TCG11439.1 hypothetical protein C4B24_02090 [Mycoplasma marinum]